MCVHLSISLQIPGHVAQKQPVHNLSNPSLTVVSMRLVSRGDVHDLDGQSVHVHRML